MQGLGAIPLVMLLVLVVLALDSRRLHALARSKVRDRRETQGGIPAGANPDQVGLPLRQIQMRIHVDWEDGGIGWEGPEILPAEEFDDALAGELSDATDVVDVTPEAQTSATMPVLWKPSPSSLPVAAHGPWFEITTLRIVRKILTDNYGPYTTSPQQFAECQ